MYVAPVASRRVAPPWCSRKSLQPLTFLVCTALGLSVGCGGSEDAAKSPNEVRQLEIVHEACNLAGGKQVDVNADGEADIVHVESGGKEVCRAIDLNFDGIKDAFIYYDAEGRERRRESDYDRDGRPDEVTVFEAGVVVRKERETNFDSKLDTWETYVGGRLAKTERDSDGDGIIDEWWDFNRPDDPKCAVVVSDRNTDGQPDPDTAVDMCGEGYKPPPPPTDAPSPSAAPAPSAPPTAAPTASASAATSAAPPPVDPATKSAPPSSTPPQGAP